MEENKKPDVFKKNNSEPIKSQAELDAQELMNERTRLQLIEREKALAKMEELGKKQTEDKEKYLKENAPSLVRPDLSEEKPKGEIIYEDDQEDETINEEEVLNDITRNLQNQENEREQKIYDELSEPQYDSLFDMVPLPSNGLLYGLQDKHIKVSFLNASDENILTNPNLLQSGKFLEILLNRKILNSRLRYKDLTIGDRDALMIWLRYTGYGDKYPISVRDPKTDTYFESEVLLSKLKIKKLTLKPNKEGNFEFKLPLSGSIVSFNYLTLGEIAEIEREQELIILEKGEEYLKPSTAILLKQIKSIDGDNNKKFIEKFVNSMRLGDVKDLRKFMDENEHGIDMNLTVRTPGGESIKTFLTINTQFFWPE